MHEQEHQPKQASEQSQHDSMVRVLTNVAKIGQAKQGIGYSHINSLPVGTAAQEHCVPDRRVN